MSVTVKPFVGDDLGTIPKGLEKKMEELKISGKLRPSRTLHYQDRREYREESWRPEETCCHLDSSERPPANAGVKNSQEVKYYYN